MSASLKTLFWIVIGILLFREKKLPQGNIYDVFMLFSFFFILRTSWPYVISLLNGIFIEASDIGHFY